MRGPELTFYGLQVLKRVCWGLWMLVFCFANCQLAMAQSVSASLKADSNQIVIGDFLNVRLTVKHSKDVKIALPKLIDTLGNMELVSESKTDTTTEGGNVLLTKTFTVSAYDSGEFHAGPLKVYFANSYGNTDSVFSNEVAVLVNTLEVDTSKPIKPIKAPLEVPYTWQEFMYYIIGAVLLILLIVAAWLMWRKYKTNKPAEAERPRPKDPAHVWAKRELKKLEEEMLWQKGEVKTYYSRLTDILRMYLEYRYEWLALESTTEEISAEIEKYDINDVAKKLLLDTLRSADLVKFAKMLPAPDANTKAMENARNFVDVTALTENKTEEKK
jgi:hypothetical protein